MWCKSRCCCKDGGEEDLEESQPSEDKDFISDVMDATGISVILFLLVSIIPLMPFIKFIMLLSTKFAKLKKICPLSIEQIKKLEETFAVLWICNILGEAIPQLIISLVYTYFNGGWFFFDYEYKSDPTLFNNHVLKMSAFISTIAIVYGLYKAYDGFKEINKRFRGIDKDESSENKEENIPLTAAEVTKSSATPIVVSEQNNENLPNKTKPEKEVLIIDNMTK